MGALLERRVVTACRASSEADCDRIAELGRPSAVHDDEAGLHRGKGRANFARRRGVF